MRSQLRGDMVVRSQLESVRLDDEHLRCRPGLCRCQRRLGSPFGRTSTVEPGAEAGSTSTMSGTKSSVTSASSTTTSRRLCAASAASRYSTPKRANRSRCSTTITPTRWSLSRLSSLVRCPLSPELTSETTLVGAIETRSRAPPAERNDRHWCRPLDSKADQYHIRWEGAMSTAMHNLVEEAAKELGRRQARRKAIRKKLEGTTTKVSSLDRMVTVTIGEAGNLESIEFNSQKFRRMPPAELGAALVETIRQAQAQTRERLLRAYQPLLP